MRNLLKVPWRLLRMLACAAGLFAAARALAASEPIFSIGKDDGSTSEFWLARESWRRYAAEVTNAVVYRVGASRPENAWPYIHPAKRDAWAGSREHTFTILFNLAEAPTGSLSLAVGQVNALFEPELAVALNGGDAQLKSAPDGSGDSSGLASGKRRPAAMLFTFPANAFRKGENRFALTIKGDTSWIQYDFIALWPGAPEKYARAEIPQMLQRLQSGECGQFDEIAFATRTPSGDPHWYANFGYYCSGTNRPAYGRGGSLCLWNIRDGKLRKLIDDPAGAVRDPCVSYDASEILFSWRRGDSQVFHLYEMRPDGTGLRQLTSGKYDDIEPCWLPDGGIVFVSGRAKRWVNCWLTQVGVIYRCDADGGNIQRLSANIEQDNTPWIMPDGRILYTRWEYVDRNQVSYHHLWTMNPDGTQHQVYFGNFHPGSVFIDAKPVPGSDEAVLINSPWHGYSDHFGHIALVSPRRGPDDQGMMRNLSDRFFCDPWAFSKDLFMASSGRRLCLVARSGKTERIFSLPGGFDREAFIAEPRPVLARPRETVPAIRARPGERFGTLYLSDICRGRNMSGAEPETIKRLLILESLPKPINYTGGMDPLSYVGTFTLARIWGTVPVEPDGSACFKLPALRSFFFVALDAENRAVKRMQSFTQVMPGELQGCVGCHEPRTSAPPQAARGLAQERAPSWPPDRSGIAFDVPDFPRDIQPILDRNCVRCHNPDSRAGGVDLCADDGPMFSMGYYSLAAWGQVGDGRNYAKSNYPPYALGSGGSPLMKKISGAHHDVRLAPEESAAIRLWLDASAPYPGTYAALGCGMIGGYQQNSQTLGNDAKTEPTLKAQPAIQRRCAACHAKGASLPKTLSDENSVSFWQPSMSDPRIRKTRHVLFDLTRPEKSLYLKAPLAKGAGGFGLCEAKSGKPVFASADDPDYRLILGMIEGGRAALAGRRFSMKGFRPREEYYREMQRYGALPESFDLQKDYADPYALDRKYWDLCPDFTPTIDSPSAGFYRGL